MRAKTFLFWLCLFLFGALISPYFEVDATQLIIISLLLFFFSFAIFSQRYLWTVVFGFGFFFIAIALFQQQTIKYKSLNTEYSEINFNFIVLIDDMPTETEHGQMSFVEVVEPTVLAGKRLIMYYQDSRDFNFGQKLAFSGKIKKFKENKENYLIKQKVVGEINANKLDKLAKNNQFSLRSTLYNLRTNINDSLAKSLPAKEASLASGLILGEKSKISPEMKRYLQASGTSHIIALSGYNITIILGLFVIFRNKLSRIANLLIPFVFATFFIIMTGASASIIRAGIMGFMPVLGQFLGRPKNSIIALLFSAAIMVAINPYILLYDVGFQLSFTAMIGLLYISPIIQSFFNSKLLLFMILSETIGAQLAVLPLLIYYFGQVSIVSPFSNLAILLLVPIGMLISFIIGFLGMLVPLLGEVVAIPGIAVLKLFYILIEFFGRLPFSSFQFKIDQPIWIFILYFLIFDLIFLFKKRDARTP